MLIITQLYFLSNSNDLTPYFYSYFIFSVYMLGMLGGSISLFFSAELFNKRFRILCARIKSPR